MDSNCKTYKVDIEGDVCVVGIHDGDPPLEHGRYEFDVEGMAGNWGYGFIDTKGEVEWLEGNIGRKNKRAINKAMRRNIKPLEQ